MKQNVKNAVKVRLGEGFNKGFHGISYSENKI